jgi:PhoPQ-activated pathogenicity-related protein
LTAIQQFVKQERDYSIPTFVVGGASKRGWDTWLVGAVDRRIIAIVPIVAPVGNITATINQMWRSYGEWTFAFEPYCQEDVPGKLNHPVWYDLVSLIDPVVFRDRLTLPKYVICATGDEFFMPQSPLFFWDDIRGDKYLRMVPNAEHSMAGHAEDVMMSVVQYMESIIHSKPIPNFDWSISPDGTTITVTSSAKPKKVVAWKAHNPHKRDFRLVVCGISNDPLCLNPILWDPQDLQPISEQNGVYTYASTQAVPSKGWLGFIVEAHYDMGFESGLDPLKITSGVSIIPQTYPYEGCGLNCTNYCPP